MKKDKSRFLKSESGQSLVELALLLPVMILILMVPMELFFYMNTKTSLSSAAADGLQEITYSDITGATVATKIRNVVAQDYGDRLDSSSTRLTITVDYGSPVEEKDFTYYVYSSDLDTGGPYQDAFDDRASNYTKKQIKVKLSYLMQPKTLLGSIFWGSSYTINTKEYTREVYVKGYTE